MLSQSSHVAKITLPGSADSHRLLRVERGKGTAQALMKKK
jgi:hypothetical protein